MNETLADDRNKDQHGDAGPSGPVQAQPRRALSGVVLVITLMVAAGGLYLAWWNRDAGLSTRAAVEGLVESREMFSARLKELAIQLEQLREQQKITSRAVQDLAQELPGSNEEWALREVEFLLIIAMHHLELERNVAAALDAMQAAALRLHGLGGAALEPVRAQLASDIKRLQDVNSIDTKGPALFLGYLAGNADSLPLAGPGKGAGKNAEMMPELPAGREGVLSALWREFRNHVIIRHEEEKKQRILLAPDQEYFVYQNLRLELENARLSLLRRDSENLHASVVSLLSFLEEYFDTHDPAVVKAITNLQQLSSINLEPAVPDIGSSLESLRAYMRGKTGVPPQGTEGRGPQS